MPFLIECLSYLLKPDVLALFETVSPHSTSFKYLYCPALLIAPVVCHMSGIWSFFKGFRILNREVWVTGILWVAQTPVCVTGVGTRWELYMKCLEWL